MGFPEALTTILSNLFYAINNDLRPINNGLSLVNNSLNLIFPWLIVTAFVLHDIFYFFRNRKKRDVLFQGTIWVIAQISAIAVFWFTPNFARTFTGSAQAPVILRWSLFVIVFISITYVYGHEHGGKRWLYSTIGHLGTLLLGWGINQWVGILFISLPIILAYYSALYILAMITLPTSNPEDKTERWKRFLVLVSYTWGVQFPIRVVADHAWKEAEVRIKGNHSSDLPFPGLIWTKSHHIVGLTGGTQFNRVAGPGVIFTGKLERPLQILDLRLQLRTNEIEAVTKDGINFSVRVFTAFRLDPETWDKSTYAQMVGMNPLLQDAEQPSHTVGSFPFSHRRVQATISTTSTKTTDPANPVLWDQWVLNMVDEATRKVVSQRTLDEFWRPLKDEKNANAMNSIAQEIKDHLAIMMRSKGILLVVSRIVNFRFTPNGEDKMAEIVRQQINTWGAEWERKRTNKLADAEANVEKDRQAAQAYAEAQLLNSIAEALQKTHDIHPRLPKHVIAMRYLNALQDYALNNPAKEEKKNKEHSNNSRAEE